MRMTRWLPLFAVVCIAAAPSRDNSYVAGTVIDPVKVTANEDAIFTYLQGGVDTYKTGSVTSAGILDGTVAAADLSDNAVTAAKLSTVTSIGSFTRDSTSASGTQAVTGVGFAPQTVIFFGNDDGDKGASWGFDRSSTRMNLLDNSSATADTYTINSTNSISDQESAGNTYVGKITSMDSDGFTITWTKTGSPSGDITVKYLAMR